MDSFSSPQPPPEDDPVVVSDEHLKLVKTRIEEGTARYFPRLDARQARVILRRFSEVSSYPLYRADVYEGAERMPAASIVVKFAPVFEDNNEGLTEYNHLRQMWESADCENGPLRVPRPLDFYADVNALVMERVGGERFSRVLLRTASRRAGRDRLERLSEAATLCGRWLRLYHGVTESSSTRAFNEDFVGAVEKKLEFFEPLGFSSSVAARVRRVARELSAYGRSITVTVSDQHGDYGPQNVHVGDDFIYVFDLNYHVPAVIYDDINYFLVTLETLNPYPRYPLFDRGKVMALGRVFLSGYFGGEEKLTAERRLLLGGYYLKSLLFRCNKQRRNVTKKGRVARGLYDLTRLRSFYPNRLNEQCDRVERLLAADSPEVPR